MPNPSAYKIKHAVSIICIIKLLQIFFINKDSPFIICATDLPDFLLQCKLIFNRYEINSYCRQRPDFPFEKSGLCLKYKREQMTLFPLFSSRYD